ncbi:MAG TPA: hypothetical protein PK275_08420 [Chitinophagaceae bacterium]|nr:hypothetical protein [Chitinophagaceae bacterium]
MGTLNAGIIKIKKLTEKERLELIEKKVEIQKKRQEIRKEKLSMQKLILENENEQLELTDKKVCIRNKRLDGKRSILEMDELKSKRRLQTEGMLNEKIISLLLSLAISVPDEERTILGSEPFETLLLKGKRRDEALNKLIELIKKL